MGPQESSSSSTGRSEAERCVAAAGLCWVGQGCSGTQGFGRSRAGEGEPDSQAGGGRRIRTPSWHQIVVFPVFLCTLLFPRSDLCPEPDVLSDLTTDLISRSCNKATQTGLHDRNGSPHSLEATARARGPACLLLRLLHLACGHGLHVPMAPLSRAPVCKCPLPISTFPIGEVRDQPNDTTVP